MRDSSADQIRSTWRRVRRVFVVAAVAVVAVGGTAYGAFVGLPSSGAQINNDGSAIDPAQSVDRSDLTTGSLTGAARVPWITFDQPRAGGGANQIFVRAFKSGAWQDEGFPESLNNDTSQSADSPSIDFTGAGRAVPWVTWAEPTPSLSATQIFASRFVTSTGQNGGQWQLEGLGRATVPSLNINTGRNADLPALIGGTTVVGGNPAPWITWQEFDGQQGACSTTFCAPQIFVSHAVAIATGCSKPTGSVVTGHNFCFQQVGADRVIGPATSQLDPSLDIDPTRSGIEADIAFTGPSDTVPWVVWYENSDSNGGHPSQISLQNEDMVFAAKAVADASASGVDGGFHWQVVGLGTAGQTNPLDVSGATHHFGPCAESVAAENGCSLNVTPGNNLSAGSGAENPSITAGTMVAGNKTTPWISWDENSSNGGQHAVFVARLDAAGDHYDLLNNGQAISHSGFDSTRSDIVFAGNTPYVSWHEANGAGQTVTVVGHFEGNPASPVFHIDTPTAGVPTTPATTSDVRAPIASTCPDDPFTGDGSACQGGAVGTPFYAYTNNASGPQALFAQGYTPGAATTGVASAITQTTASLAGAVSTDGAATLVHFDFGTTTAYGTSTAGQLVAPASGVSTSVAAALTGLPTGTVIHYRVVAQTDFGTVDGADQTFQTLAVPVPPVVVGKPSQSHASLSGLAKRKARLSFTVNAGSNAPAIKTISVSLPRGLAFARKTKQLTNGITLRGANGKRLKFTVKRSHGTLQITLKSPASTVRVTIGGSAITVSAKLAKAVAHKRTKRLSVVLRVTDAGHKTTRLTIRLKVR
jgi:hypothetical protein